jgi:hypothetical protein
MDQYFNPNLNVQIDENIFIEAPNLVTRFLSFAERIHPLVYRLVKPLFYFPPEAPGSLVVGAPHLRLIPKVLLLSIGTHVLIDLMINLMFYIGEPASILNLLLRNVDLDNIPLWIAPKYSLTSAIKAEAPVGVIKALLDLGGDPNQSIITAIKQSASPEILDLLISNGASIHCDNGSDCLSHALYRNPSIDHIEIFAKLTINKRGNIYCDNGLSDCFGYALYRNLSIDHLEIFSKHDTNSNNIDERLVDCGIEQWKINLFRENTDQFCYNVKFVEYPNQERTYDEECLGFIFDVFSTSQSAVESILYNAVIWGAMNRVQKLEHVEPMLTYLEDTYEIEENGMFDMIQGWLQLYRFYYIKGSSAHNIAETEVHLIENHGITLIYPTLYHVEEIGLPASPDCPTQYLII